MCGKVFAQKRYLVVYNLATTFMPYFYSGCRERENCPVSRFFNVQRGHHSCMIPLTSFLRRDQQTLFLDKCFNKTHLLTCILKYLDSRNVLSRKRPTENVLKLRSSIKNLVCRLTYKRIFQLPFYSAIRQQNAHFNLYSEQLKFLPEIFQSDKF